MSNAAGSCADVCLTTFQGFVSVSAEEWSMAVCSLFTELGSVVFSTLAASFHIPAGIPEGLDFTTRSVIHF